MHYTTSIIGSTTRYKYFFENNTSCVFLVSKVGIIYIDIKEKIPNEFLSTALNEVTDIVVRKGYAPKINIKNTNFFLQNLARKCKYRKIPSKGVSFSVWIRPNI